MEYKYYYTLSHIKFINNPTVVIVADTKRDQTVWRTWPNYRWYVSLIQFSHHHFIYIFAFSFPSSLLLFLFVFSLFAGILCWSAVKFFLDYDYLFKISLIGARNVGVTTFANMMLGEARFGQPPVPVDFVSLQSSLSLTLSPSDIPFLDLYLLSYALTLFFFPYALTPSTFYNRL